MNENNKDLKAQKVPNAEYNFERVKEICNDIAKKHFGKIFVEVCEKDYLARVTLSWVKPII